ncbi:MAG: hypothetical protein MJB57_04115 [Gemmatimonadetes bacterium]|nr:hypothetical protein [Gemmatimonadota bacterium]
MFDRNRRPFVISIAVSAAIHGALLAWVVIDVPLPAGSDRSTQRSGPLATEDPPTEEVVHVVQIRPPGVMGGGAPAGSAGASGAGTDPGSAKIEAALAEPQSPRGSLTLSPAQPMALALRAPVAPAPAVVLADLPSAHHTTARSARPNRGLIVRAGTAGDEPASGRFGAGRAGRGGVGLGGAGTASIGPGEDCITIGSARPEGRIPRGIGDMTRGLGQRGGRSAPFSGGRRLGSR